VRNGFKVFDADAHVVEPRDLWERFLEPKYKGRVTWRQPCGAEGMTFLTLRTGEASVDLRC
jgi:hypothetical protein